jgi:asparagine synthase (glutamine-hydrolysing)
MHHSIECRVPFLDLELVRFAESLPLSCRLGILQGKLLHKRFAKTMLPSSIVQRKKNGFNSPTGSWFRSSMNVFRETLLNPRSHLANYFDLAEVKKVLDEHATGLNRERHIFLLLSIHHWMTAHFELGTRVFGASVGTRGDGSLSSTWFRP